MLVEFPRAPTLISALLAAMALAACTTSESVSLEDGAASPSTTGAASGPGSGAAGTSGAGAGTGNPTSSGAAGTTGAAGTGATQTGVAGRSGTGAAGTGAAGTSATGAAGRGGAGGGAPAVDAGAGSDAASDGAMPLTYTNYIGPIMTLNNCGGCHYISAGVAVQGGFGLSYANVMGAVTAAHAGCPNLDASKRRVVPGKPDNSLIYIKVTVANLPSSCGGHMPYMGYEWSATYKQALRDWILQGAKE